MVGLQSRLAPYQGFHRFPMSIGPSVESVYSAIDFIGFRRHDEIVPVQAADLVSPPLNVQIARIPKNLVHCLSLNVLVASSHKTLVHCRSVNLAVDRNHKTRLPLLAG